jgi:seryl-tRNA synthetase
MTAIDWKLLTDALDYYKSRGFAEVPVNWHVRREVHDVTCSDPARMFGLKDYGILVGSAEQAFIEMQLDGRLPSGRYVALTPCFRDEGAGRDDLHALYFMKVELYSTMHADDCYGDIQDLCHAARAFMSSRTSLPVIAVPTSEGIDLEINGIEVGSYSHRSFGGISWTCGTGLAEPRFSMAVAVNS